MPKCEIDMGSNRVIVDFEFLMSEKWKDIIIDYFREKCESAIENICWTCNQRLRICVAHKGGLQENFTQVHRLAESFVAQLRRNIAAWERRKQACISH